MLTLLECSPSFQVFNASLHRVCEATQKLISMVATMMILGMFGMTYLVVRDPENLFDRDSSTTATLVGRAIVPWILILSLTFGMAR